MSDDLLLVERQRGVATLTLNRPKAFNSLSFRLLTRIDETLQELEQDTSVQVIVFKGAGDKAFCAGHDLKEMGADLRHDPIKALFDQCSAMMMRIARQPQPVIAAVDGIATAAGCQLVAACDLAIATSGSRFATSGVKYGLFCSTPMVALSRNIHRKAAMELLLTGDFIDSKRALELGLINSIHDDLEEGLNDLCARLLDKPPAVLALGKRAFYRQLEMGLSEAYSFTADVITENALDADFREGLDAFTQKRSPVWTKNAASNAAE